MPLVRYFLFTGAMLVGLLFLADGYFPKPAAAVAADIDRSVIRIHTSQRWPAAVPIDTSAPMPRIAPQTVAAESAMPLPSSIREAKAYAPAVSPKPSELPTPSEKSRRHLRGMAKSPPPQAHSLLAYQDNWSSEAR